MLFWQCQKDKTQPPITAVTKTQIDSTKLGRILQINTGVCIGNSIIAGHPWRNSGLELDQLNYPDSFGQITWHLTQLTHMPWFNAGIGGQTTGQIRNRFLRDAVGDTLDAYDGRPTVTLAAKPAFVVIEGGVNDIAYNVSLDSIEDNLAWMASICKLNKIHCIVLNCVGQGYNQFTQSQTDAIGKLNDWLASGALDSVQVTVIDINSIWNSGTYGGVSEYGNDNVHFSTLVNGGDGIHFTQAGYDSVAHVIYRVARLPAF